jgi:hypothetical protein
MWHCRTMPPCVAPGMRRRDDGMVDAFGAVPLPHAWRASHRVLMPRRVPPYAADDPA